MDVISVMLAIGALIVSGLLCSFLVFLGLNKKKFWEEIGECMYGRK